MVIIAAAFCLGIIIGYIMNARGVNPRACDCVVYFIWLCGVFLHLALML